MQHIIRTFPTMKRYGKFRLHSTPGSWSQFGVNCIPTVIWLDSKLRPLALEGEHVIIAYIHYILVSLS